MKARWTIGLVMAMVLITGATARAEDSTSGVAQATRTVLEGVARMPVFNILSGTMLAIYRDGVAVRDEVSAKPVDAQGVGPQTDRDSALFAGD